MYFKFFLLISVFSVSACSIQRNNTHYQVFFVGDEGNQYFIKPAEFNGQNSDIELDFVFRYKDEIKDSVNCNFSLYSKTDLIKSAVSFQLLNSTQTILSSTPELLFVETEKRGFESRFTCKFSLQEFADLTANKDWHILLQTSLESEPKLFFPDRKSKVMQEKLANNIIVLL